MEPVIVFISLFATVFGIVYYYLFTRNKERLALIQAGADASLFQAPPSKGTALSIALIIGEMAMGIGLGVFVAYMVEQHLINQQLEMVKNGLLESVKDQHPQLYVMAIFFFGGIGLVSSFYQLRGMRKKETGS